MSCLDRSSRYKSRSRSPSRSEEIKKEPVETEPMEEEVENEDEDEEAKMMRLMGFGNFDTTKEKKVAGADVSGSKVHKPIKYRQYMNRRGGFNR